MKTEIFNAELTSFDDTIQAYRRGSVPFGDHVHWLFPNSSIVPASIRTFLDALHYEKTLDFDRVQKERKGLIEALISQSSDEETRELLGRTLAMRLGSVSVTDYYEYLFGLITDKNINIVLWPAFRDYFTYLALARALDYAGIHGAVWEAEQFGYAARCRTEREQALLLEADRIYLVGRLFDYLQGKLGVARLAANHTIAPKAAEQFTQNMEQMLNGLLVESSQAKPSLWSRSLSVVRQMFKKRSNN